MVSKGRRGERNSLCHQLPTGLHQVYLRQLRLGSEEQPLQMQVSHFAWCGGNPLGRGSGLLSPVASKGQKWLLGQLHPGWGGQSPPWKCLWTGGWEHKVSLDLGSESQAQALGTHPSSQGLPICTCPAPCFGSHPDGEAQEDMSQRGALRDRATACLQGQCFLPQIHVHPGSPSTKLKRKYIFFRKLLSSVYHQSHTPSVQAWLPSRMAVNSKS